MIFHCYCPLSILWCEFSWCFVNFRCTVNRGKYSLRDHLFRTYAKFSEKLTLLTLWYARAIHTKWFLTQYFQNMPGMASNKNISCDYLTLFWSMFPFYTPWKHQKTITFLMFSGGIKWEHWPETDYSPWPKKQQNLGRSTNSKMIWIHLFHFVTAITDWC